MAAIVRFLTLRANGREAVRLVEVARDSFTIGRGAGSDVQLGDLRVGLAHATVSILSTGAVAVEGVERHDLQSGGRRVRRAELKLDVPRDIGIGPYRLTFQADAEVEGRLRIDVRRVEAPVARISAEQAERVFSLKGSWLGKRAPAWTLALTTLAVFLAFPLWTFAHRPAPVGASSIGPRSVFAAPPGPMQTPAALTGATIGAGRMWSPGRLSTAHAFLARDCASCHRGALVAVSDDTCLGCHKGLQAHADPALMATARPRPGLVQVGLQAISARFDKPAGRCVSCHLEHQGAQGAGEGLVVRGQALCSDCHARLDQRIGDRATVRDASDFFTAHPQFRPTLIAAPGQPPALTRRWSITELDAARRLREAIAPRFDAARCAGFSIGQPNFRGLAHLGDRPGVPARAFEGDNPGLVFPHALHMSATGCVASLARRLGVRTDAGGAMGCADCHTPDASGAGFVPVSMERNCSTCHSLVFDTFDGVDRKLPHGQPLQVIASMMDFYRAEAVNLAIAPPSAERHLPGEAAADRTAELRQLALVNANARAATRVRAIFSPGGACYGCHQLLKPASGVLYGVAPVTLQESFFPRSAFDHKAHATAGMSCEQCHAARSSQSAADVLTPGVETCRTCHAGEHAYAAVPSPCVECHRFHAADPSAPLMKAHSLEVLGAPRRVATGVGSPAAVPRG